MSKRQSDFKRRKRRRLFLILLLGVLTLFFIAAMLHIGVGQAEWAGMTVSNLSLSLATEFNIPKDEEGVVVNWVEGPAYYSGVKEGDLLKAINNKKVRNIAEFLKVAKGVNLNEGALLDVLRDSQPLYVTLYNIVGLHERIKQVLMGRH
ncbi:MAG: hypothetical protein JSW40_00625 [Candidatus Omnitrophota bacterium]|nr:MAG: hypothetical protein JSW40_00625 [Candidatus Omnitrophota bacterium]